MLHDPSKSVKLVEQESVSNKLDEKPDVLDQWEKTWAEYFRQDETRVDAEIQDLCNRLRALATSIES